jgi:hypothetical protein
MKSRRVTPLHHGPDKLITLTKLTITFCVFVFPVISLVFFQTSLLFLVNETPSWRTASPAPAISWVPAVGNYNATSTAVVGGFDINGETLYVSHLPLS